MSEIEVFEPGTEAHGTVAEAVSKSSMSKIAATEHYNAIAVAYNGSSIEAYIRIDGKGIRLSNLEKVFFNRGIIRDTDYTLFRPNVDVDGKRLHREDRPVLLQKLTDAVMRIV